MSKQKFFEEREYQEDSKNLIQTPKKNPLALDLRHSISDLGDLLIMDVKDGLRNPLEAFEQFKMISEVLKDAMSKIEADAEAEVLKSPKQIKSCYGNEIKYSEGRRTFSYENNPSIVALKEKIKALENIAKVITSPVADTESGEMIFPGMVTYGKSSISITIKNK